MNSKVQRHFARNEHYQATEYFSGACVHLLQDAADGQEPVARQAGNSGHLDRLH